jgi:hypothetical protein
VTSASQVAGTLTHFIGQRNCGFFVSKDFCSHVVFFKGAGYAFHTSFCHMWCDGTQSNVMGEGFFFFVKH